MRIKSKRPSPWAVVMLLPTLISPSVFAQATESSTIPSIVRLPTSSPNLYSATPPATAAVSIGAPQLQGQTASFNERYEHRRLGEWAIRRLNANVRMVQDPWVQDTLRQMSWQLNAQVRQQAPLAILVIDDPSINAFAIPGGVIGIHTGTVMAAQSLDEVASVLAHEVAHLSQRHYEHGSDARRQSMLIQLGGMLAAIAASSASGDAAAAVMLGAQTAALNNQMSYSREHEREADRLGMQILAQAGYDPRAMPSFFDTMQGRSQLNHSASAFIPSFVKTHPLTQERLSDTRARAERYPMQSLAQTRKHSQAFDLLLWRVRLLAGQTPLSTLESAATNSFGARLALALGYAKQQRHQDAEAAIDPLLALPETQQQALEPLLTISHAELLGLRGNWVEATQLLQTQQQLYPERRDLRLYLAEALVQQDDAGAAAQAQAVLQPLAQPDSSDRQLWQLLQRTSEVLARHSSDDQDRKLGDVQSLFYRSYDELWQGQFDLALASLHRAQAILKDSRIQDEQIQGHEAQSREVSLASSVLGPANSSLLRRIEQQIAVVEQARDFRP